MYTADCAACHTQRQLTCLSKSIYQPRKSERTHLHGVPKGGMIRTESGDNMSKENECHKDTRRSSRSGTVEW